jgi:thioredoxin reductase (NADPH)
VARVQEELTRHPEIEQVLSAVVEEIFGEKRVEGIRLKNLADGTARTIEVDGVFVSTGQQPNTEFLKGKLKMDESGRLITDETMQTSEPGVFACGDVRRKDLYQVITACSDGALAAHSAEKYLVGVNS